MNPCLAFQTFLPDINFSLIMPELIVGGVAVLVMLVDAFVRSDQRWVTGGLSLAGLGAGFWSSLDDLSRNWQVDRRFEPRMSRDEATQRLRRWSLAVERARHWADGA